MTKSAAPVQYIDKEYIDDIINNSEPPNADTPEEIERKNQQEIEDNWREELARN